MKLSKKITNKRDEIAKQLKGQRYLFPQINQPNNEALVLAMQQTSVKVGSHGFQKDKSGEKLVETEEDHMEHRTDDSDTFDMLFIGMNFYGYESSARGVGIRVLKW